MTDPFESLEARFLFSISTTGNDLTVRGTGGNDVIEFQRLSSSRSFQIKINGQDNGPFKAIYRIRVQSLGGDDAIFLQELTNRNITVAVVNAGDGDDTVYGSAKVNLLHGGAGDDALVGGGYFDQIFGEAGNDNLVGGSGHDTLGGGDGNNTLRGGGGNDFLSAGSGTDVFSGGPGLDWVSYGEDSASKPLNLSLTLDGIANDGRRGERDQIMSDIENIEAGPGDDLIVGNSRDNQLIGGHGNDTIHGGGGNDVIGDGLCIHGPHKRTSFVDCLRHEQPFADELFGDGGDDTLMAYAGADTLDGGSGNDRFELLGLVDPSPSSLIEGGTGSDVAVIRSIPDSVLDVESVLDQHGRPFNSQAG